jgi:hypothetical protein
MAETMPGELAHDPFRVGLAVQLQLVERLHRREPGDAAPPATCPRPATPGLRPFQSQTAG